MFIWVAPPAVGIFKNHFLKGGTSRERMAANGGDTIGDGDAAQTVAVAECIITNADDWKVIVGFRNCQFASDRLAAIGHDLAVIRFVEGEG